MNTKLEKNKNLIQNLGWLFFGTLAVLAFREFYLINILAFVSSDNLFASRRFIMFLVISIVAVILWIAYYLLFVRKHRQLSIPLIRKMPIGLQYFSAGLISILPALTKWVLPLPENFELGSWTMIFLFYCVSIIAADIFNQKGSSSSRLLRIGILFMLCGAWYSIFSKMDLVTSYPFTTYWSEGNRFFDYSTLFGRFRYIVSPGEKIKAFINWGMQLPWAIPFVLPNLSIGAFRLWYQLVWIIPSLILGWVALPNKKNKTTKLIAVVFAFWTYLFLDQGPIYAPLIIAAIFTIIAIRLPLTPAAVIIIIASYYVHSARWTWGYAPGIWAGLLTLLLIDDPSFNKASIKQLIKPVVLGIAGYFGGQLLPSLIKALTIQSKVRFIPNPTASTTRQPLIWDRLMPNPTYPPGIILGLMWAILPLIIFLIILGVKKYWKVNWLQNISMIASAGAFLIVGIIASTKIGGGSNLHNLDMFLVTLVVIASAAFTYLVAHDHRVLFSNSMVMLSLIAVFITPVTFTLQNKDKLVLPTEGKTSEALSAVKNKVDEYNSKGKILFIDHRQLLTFGLVKNVQLFDEYEKKYLMDYALADDEMYFHGFYEDLYNHTYALIINEPSNIIIRGSEYSFGEENDAYVNWVTAPLLCMYEPIYTSQETAVELLVPRTSPAPINLPCEKIFSFLND